MTLTNRRFQQLFEHMDDLLGESDSKDKMKTGRVHLGGNFFVVRGNDRTVTIKYSCQDALAAAAMWRRVRADTPSFYNDDDEKEVAGGNTKKDVAKKKTRLCSHTMMLAIVKKSNLLLKRLKSLMGCTQR